MRAVLLFVTFLLILPSIAFAWPFDIHEGEQAAELYMFNSQAGLGTSALLGALAFAGIYALRKRKEIAKEGALRTSVPFLMSGAKFYRDYYLGLADVYKGTTISSLRFVGSAVGALIDQAAKEEVQKKVGKDVGKGIRPDFSKPMYERMRRWADKLDKKLPIPGEKKIFDEGYFYDPAHRGRNLGHIMGELQVMSVPAPAASKGWKYAKQWNRARQVVTGIKVARSAQYARAAINAALKVPAAIASVAPKVGAAVKSAARAVRTVSAVRTVVRSSVTRTVSRVVGSVYKAVSGFFRR